MSNQVLEQTLPLCSKVKELCAPLSDQLGLKFFRYVRTEKSGKRFNLCTSEAWLKKYVDEKFYIDEYANFYILPDNIKGLGVGVEYEHYKYKENPIFTFWTDVLEMEGISTVMTLYQSFDDYIELANFGFEKSEINTINLFLNNQIIFEKFLLYVKDKLYDHFPEPAFLGKPVNKSIDSDYLRNWIRGITPQEHNNILDGLQVENLHLEGNLSGTFLNQKECQCLNYVLQGFKYDYISEKLNYSKRNIETIMKNIKTKLKIKSKTELFEMAYKYNLGEKLKLVVGD